NAIVEQVKGADMGAQLIALVAPDPKAETPQIATAAPAEERQTAVSQEDSNAAALMQLAADLRPSTPSSDAAKTPVPPAAAPLLPGQARTLAFYQANAGQRIPAVDGGRGSASTKYALPVATQSAFASKALPIAAADEKPAEPAIAREGAPEAWFASAMLRGLDRYRASQQLNKAPSQLDLSQ
ncbi:MAG TPA: hypothetical protein VHM01_16385, partial [Alphaproteobacteria bacterium]|nr:hypothetical protein [Alphaproteobacteria bacterium]